MSVTPKKSLGQHFLIDNLVARGIVASLDIEPADLVVEVGPGTGALTGLLLQRSNNLVAYEVDDRSVAVLQRRHPELKLYAQSILQADLPAHARQTRGRLLVIGNLPYFLTSQILFYVMDQGRLVNQAVFMIQREVADRLLAEPRTKAYGILSVQAQVLGRVQRILDVPPDAFDPPPSVHSTVIRWQPGNSHYPRSAEDLPVPLSRFKTVVRTAFNQRRKKLSNALSSLFADGIPDGWNADRRAEELMPHEFVELARLWEQ